MRPSSYIVPVKLLNGNFLLVQGYTGAVDEVPPNVAKLLREKTVDEQICFKHDVYKETYNKLVSRGYLTERSFEQEVEHIKRIAITIQKTTMKHYASFMIVPTYQCNLRCFYCFETENFAGDSDWLNRTISTENVDAAFEAMESLKPKRDSLHKYQLTLYGGEPLMARNRSTIEYIVRNAMESGYVIGAISNGTELEAYYDLLGPEMISGVQITFDGMKNSHDQRRIGTDKAPTFDIISRNIGEALKRDIGINLRLNLDKNNVDEAADISRHIAANKWQRYPKFHVYAHSLYNHADHEQGANGQKLYQLTKPKSDDLTLYQLSKALEKRRDEMPVYISAYDSYVSTIFQFLLRNGKIPLLRSWWCSAHVGLYIFDAHGDIFTCWDEVGHENKKVGTYGPGKLEFNERLDMWLGRTIASVPQCSECSFALLCGGGCAFLAEEKTGTYFASHCNQIQKMFVDAVPKAYQQYLETRGQAAPSSAV
jgi:uncharacterized protein